MFGEFSGDVDAANTFYPLEICVGIHFEKHGLAALFSATPPAAMLERNPVVLRLLIDATALPPITAMRTSLPTEDETKR